MSSMLKLLLPLPRESCRADDERSPGVAALFERLPHHARFNGFPQAHFVRQHKAPSRA